MRMPGKEIQDPIEDNTVQRKEGNTKDTTEYKKNKIDTKEDIEEYKKKTDTENNIENTEGCKNSGGTGGKENVDIEDTECGQKNNVMDTEDKHVDTVNHKKKNTDTVNDSENSEEEGGEENVREGMKKEKMNKRRQKEM